MASETAGDEAERPWSRGSEPAGALVARYAAVVCDLDGVVYRGPTAVPHAVEVLGALDVPVLYATNNASRSPDRRGGAPARARPGVHAGCRRHQLAGRRLAARRAAAGRQPGAGRRGRRSGDRPARRPGCAPCSRPRPPAAPRSRPCCRATAPRCTADRPGRGGLRRRGRRHLGGDQHRRHAARPTAGWHRATGRWSPRSSAPSARPPDLVAGKPAPPLYLMCARAARRCPRPGAGRR